MVWTTIRGLAAMLFSVAIFVGVVSLVILVSLGRGPREVTVPNVVELPLEQAKQMMTENGLELVVVHEMHSTETAEGSIAETRPAAGKVTRQGRRVEAVVSLGPKNVKVPELVGHSFETAQQRITGANLQLGGIVRKADSTPRDYVLAQSPAAGKVVGRSHAVDLVLSGGPEYGRAKSDSGQTLVFRTVELIVPRGQPLQRVVVKVVPDDGDTEKTFYSRVHRPGDEVKADFYAPRGGRLQVSIDDDRVLNKEL